MEQGAPATINGAIKKVLLGGLLAGTIDIGSASLINMVSPFLILHFIASGLIGKASFHGGLSTAALGLCLQWAMSIIIAAIFVLAARALPFLRQRWLLSGCLYGFPVFVVMTFVVAPLSNALKPGHFMPIDKIAENLVAMMLFGAIISFFL